MKAKFLQYAVGLSFCFFASSGFSAGIEQNGTQPTDLARMQSYGVGVPGAQALKAIMPKGWQVSVHPEVTLPDSVSWKLNQTWVDALGGMARESSLAVLLDWSAKRAYILTGDQVVQENAVREEIALAAVTPLPEFDAADEDDLGNPLAFTPTKKKNSSKKSKAKAKQPAKAEPTSERKSVDGGYVWVNPLAEDTKKREAQATANASLKSTSEFRYTQAVAYNKPPARKLAQSIADKFNYRLVWAAPEMTLEGPVTLLARSASEDIELLQKAMGAYAPVALEVADKEKVVRALSRDLLRKGAAQRDAAYALAETQSLAAAQSRFSLMVADNEPLEDAILRFVRSEGFTLEWKVKGGFEANRNMTFVGASLIEVLSQVLPPLGLSADVYTHDKHIVVRPGEGRDR
ncbi:hypothetical protein LC612_23140 [Nostoc sp. CHAB 5834]|nr:hypothetical protein [Nostoc sp. CHAB 5834]